MVRKVETFPPVTMGHIRGDGCRDLLRPTITPRSREWPNLANLWRKITSKVGRLDRHICHDRSRKAQAMDD